MRDDGWWMMEGPVLFEVLITTRDYSVLALLPLNFFQILHCDSIVIAVHGFFCANQSFDVENPAFAIGQFHFNAVFQYGFKVADTQNLAETVNDSQIRFQIQIFVSANTYENARE